MSLQTWEELIYSSVADATAVTGTSETIMVPDFTFPANYFYAGRMVRARVAGVISNVITAPGTVTLRARLGGVAGTLLVASAAISQNIVAQTNDQWEAEFYITCRVAGASGTLFSAGKTFLGNIVGASAGQVQFIPVSGNAAVSSLNLASSAILSLTAQFSASGNSLTVQQYTLEALN